MKFKLLSVKVKSRLSGKKCTVCNGNRRTSNCRLFKFPEKNTDNWLKWKDLCCISDVGNFKNLYIC